MDKQGTKRYEKKERNKTKYKPHNSERPISSVYPVIDTDLARDNIENDLSSADLQDL